jgi:hypothetical protein
MLQEENSESAAEVFDSFVILSAWCLWLERNARVFELHGSGFIPNGVVGFALVYG